MLGDALNEILDLLNRDALRALCLTPVTPDALEAEVGQVGSYLQPSYLPFTSDSDESMALYLRPAIPLLASPIVRLDNDNHEARFVASSLENARTALCLAMAVFFDSAQEVIAAAKQLGGGSSQLAALAGDVEQGLATVDASERGLWTAHGSAEMNALWASASLDHPFARISGLSYGAEPDDARRIIERIVPKDSRVPELRALLVSARAATGDAPAADEVRAVLEAEAWRDRDPVVRGVWREESEGLAEWDATLQIACETDGALDEPFDRLRKCPRLYSGNEDEGADLLMEVGRAFERAGQWNPALNQYRNAAAVAGLSGDFVGDVTRDDCFAAIANACDQIEPGCLAAEVARVSARAIAAGL